MNKTIFKYLLFIVLSTIVMLCKVTKTYQSPVINTDSLFRDRTTTDTTTIADLHWNELFTDPVLQNLIADGIAHNLDLQMAFTRIQQSQAYYLQSGDPSPTLNANTGVTFSQFSKTQAAGLNNATQFQLGVSAGWEADIW